jgi:biopolymer transport protein TolR
MPQLSRETGSTLSEINIVPFVDVVLVLLLIFMITEARLVVTIDRSQRVYLGDTPINIHDLGNQVRAKSSDPAHQPVYLRSDETVPFGSVTTVLDALQQAGVLNVQIVTKPLTERAQSQ